MTPVKQDIFLKPDYDLVFELQDTVSLIGMKRKLGENTNVFDVYSFKKDILYRRARLWLVNDTDKTEGFFKGKFTILNTGFSGYMWVANLLKLKPIWYDSTALLKSFKKVKIKEEISNPLPFAIDLTQRYAIFRAESKKKKKDTIIHKFNAYYFIFDLEEKEIKKVIKTEEGWVEE